MEFIALLLLIHIRLAFAGSHSLQYLYTGVSGVLHIPEFTVVGFVDDQQFMYFDSNTRKAVPKKEWIRQNEGEDYWNSQSETVIGLYQEYKIYMQRIIGLYTQSMSEGVHTLQVMYGCKLEDDGATRGYYKFGFDGEDFISFDIKTLSWTHANPQVDDIKKKWDADRAKSEHWKTYLENECIESLKKYVRYSGDSLQRKVPPKVFLRQKDPSSPLVACHATGFYPSDIIMNWKKNHKILNKNVSVSSTLPNEDGSFQKSISLSVNPEEWKNNPDLYRCVLQYVGEKQIIVFLNKTNIMSVLSVGWDNNSLISVGCVLAIICVVAIICLAAVKCIKTSKSKKSDSTGYTKSSTTDTDSVSKSDEEVYKYVCCRGFFGKGSAEVDVLNQLY